MKILRIALLSACVLLLGYCCYYYATTPSVSSVTALVNKEVPTGSSYEVVTSFLDRHLIHYGHFIGNGPETPEYLRNTLTAYINPNSRFLWLTSALTIRFWFSNDQKLERFSVQEDWSGLP